MSAAANRGPADPDQPYDLVGPRVLSGVQLVNISRLSTHPVPLTHRGLITVAGQGPTDSNGAGKSSFIAALSLLHADDQWRLAGGAPGAAELLFTAELAAQEARWANADNGYVIGVFTDPAARTPEELASGALSVWLRVNRKAPYLSLRWFHGLYVPHGPGEAERAAGVEDLWRALPASNGRDDFHAGRLSTVLYGGHVRCVSFLSTSVRSSPTANLLAQPLNELSPPRIFDAIATLTGLDRELEQEQALRSGEHARRAEVVEAETELARWQHEMDVVETGIARRATARDNLAAAGRAWRSRCARHLEDGVARTEELRHALDQLATGRAELTERARTGEETIAQLTDDDAFHQRFRATEEDWARLREQERQADGRCRDAAKELETLAARVRQLRDGAGAADGLSGEEAAEQLKSAQQELEEVLAARGAAVAAARQARDRLRSAEAGGDAAADQLRALTGAGVAAAAVVDVLAVSAGQREVWDPLLHPYREAVVVGTVDAVAARTALDGLPGSVLVLDDGTRPGNGMPGCTDPRFGLGTFLSALRERSGQTPGDVDPAAGVVVTGGFPAAVTGRDARVAGARTALDDAETGVADLDARLARARTRLDTATRRLAGAQAADEADQLGERIEEGRARLDLLRLAHEGLREPLADAEAAHAGSLADRRSRQDRIAALRAEAARLRSDLSAADQLADRLRGELLAIDLPAREAAWGGGPDTARAHLLDLPDEEQSRTATEWNTETCHLLDDVTRRCFADDTPPEQLPAELRTLLVEQRWRRASPDTKVALAPDLTRALRTHLDLTAQQDAHDQQHIDAQRVQRRKDLEAARSGLHEAEQAGRAHRAVLAQAVKAKLRRVGEEFDRLDRDYGGYGATLEFTEPEPPTEPDKPWRWSVTPKWRRAEGQRMSGYGLRGNTAQMDEKAVKLVCAAALASGSDRPLLLVLDELGRNLGKQHRREAVALFERIGRDQNITVIGALQDDMERYAIEASNLYIKLRRSSDASAYNDAPIVQGDEPNRDRVELLRAWMSSFRPAPPAAGDDSPEPGAAVRA